MHRKRITKSNEFRLEIEKYDTRKKEWNVKRQCKQKEIHKKR